MTDGTLKEIRTARRELEQVIQEIRRLPDHGDFLGSPRFVDVCAAAIDQPLVYIAAAELGGLALVVRGADVVHVPLPQLRADAVRDRVDFYQRRYDAFRMDPKRELTSWNATLDVCMKWLWDAVMGPVLEELDPAPAAVLVAGGLLGFLPLHAAWTEDATAPTGRRYALDKLTLSYTPNARALTAARKRAALPARTLLVVDPSASPLSGTSMQALAAAAAFPGAVTPLPGAQASPQAVVTALASADVAHFACHGFADLTSPLDSGMNLAGDTLLSLGDLLALSLNLRLAVLTACETSLPGTALPDEVVALPTGLLQAGVGGVVASMWRVPEQPTTRLVTEFYRRWRGEQLAPAVALQRAQQWLRDTSNKQKIVEYEKALASSAGWLPHEVAVTVLSDLMVREPGDLEDRGLEAWGAFAFVGA